MADDIIPVEAIEFAPLYVEDEETVRERLLDPFVSNADPEARFSVRPPGFLYDFATILSLEFARFYDRLNQSAAAAFLVAASGDQLDQKGVELNRPRNPATYSSTILTLEAPDTTVIPAGTRFSTTTTGDDEAVPVEFASLAEVTVGVTGVASVPVRSLVPGAATKVGVGTIIQMVDMISGVVYVTNEFPAIGGTDEENDDVYRGRLILNLRASGGPGVRSDYRDWAREVPGVSDAIIFPHWDGGGTVKVVVIGSDLTIPTTETLRNVQDYLDPSVAVLASMEVDELWTSVTYSTTQSEGASSVQIDVPGATTILATFLRNEHLDYIASPDVFTAWVDVVSPLNTVTAIRFGIRDDADLVAYKEFVAADLALGSQVKEWTLAQMTVPVGFDWTALEEFQLSVQGSGVGPATVRFDAWRVYDSDGGVGQGKAPVGAQVTVSSARLRPVVVQVVVLPDPGFSLSGLQPFIEENIRAYLASRRSTSGFLFLSEIANVINDTTGVQTYYNLRLDGVAQDLTLLDVDVPVLQLLLTS